MHVANYSRKPTKNQHFSKYKSGAKKPRLKVNHFFQKKLIFTKYKKPRISACYRSLCVDNKIFWGGAILTLVFVPFFSKEI